MEYYVGLDVAVKRTAICIVDRDGEVIREAALYTEPETLAAFLHGTGLRFKRVGLEAGPLSSWLHGGLAAAGLAVVCVEAPTLLRRGGGQTAHGADQAFAGVVELGLGGEAAEADAHRGARQIL